MTRKKFTDIIPYLEALIILCSLMTLFVFANLFIRWVIL